MRIYSIRDSEGIEITPVDETREEIKWLYDKRLADHSCDEMDIQDGRCESLRVNHSSCVHRFSTWDGIKSLRLCELTFGAI